MESSGMDDYSVAVRRVAQWVLFLLSASLLGWAFSDPEAKPLFAGFGLGATVSLLNALYTAYKINRLGQIALSGQKKPVSLGTVNRFASSLLAALIAVRYPQTFALIPVIIGLIATQAIALLFGLTQIFKTSNGRSRKG